MFIQGLGIFVCVEKCQSTEIKYQYCLSISYIVIILTHLNIENKRFEMILTPRFKSESTTDGCIDHQYFPWRNQQKHTIDMQSVYIRHVFHILYKQLMDHFSNISTDSLQLYQNKSISVLLLVKSTINMRREKFCNNSLCFSIKFELTSKTP